MSENKQAANEEKGAEARPSSTDKKEQAAKKDSSDKKEPLQLNKIVSNVPGVKVDSILSNLSIGRRQTTLHPIEPAQAALDEGLTMGELVVRLDTYDDIFSDFDPRPHSRRELSEDLIKELGRRYRENPKGGLEMRFYIPASAREPRLEGVIRKRLKEHFEFERQKIRTQIKEHRQKGMRYASVGLMFLIGELVLTLSTDELWARVVGLLLAPAGWFALWTGLEKLVEVPYNLEHMQAFYDKFSKCNYVFVSQGAE